MERKLSYPDSLKLLEESIKKDRAINCLMEQMLYDSKEQAIKAVNKLLIEEAEKTGMSLYDLCFHTVPENTYSKPIIKGPLDSQSFEFKQEVRLVPVVFDLIHDGGYWRGKYFELKKELQDIINKPIEDKDA